MNRIITSNPMRTAHRVRQLASTFPLECARALSAQPEAIVEVGSALARLAEAAPAAAILATALRRRPDLMNAARSFYDRRRELQPAPIGRSGTSEITTAKERP